MTESEHFAGFYVPRKKPGFLDDQIRVPNRIPPRWRSADGDRLFEYDPRHGHIEGYNRRGKHVGVFDVETGARIGEAVRGRSIDV